MPLDMPEVDLKDTAKAAAQSPAEVTGDSGSVKARTIDEIIKADRYDKSIAGMAQKRKGLRFMKFVSPGAD